MDHSEDRSLEQSPVDEWVADKFASLRPPTEWQPNADVGWALLRRGQHAGRVRRQTALLAVAATIVIGGLLAFPQSRVLAERCVDACVTGTSGIGHLFGFRASVEPSAAERRLAPALNLVDVQGREVNLAKLRGQVVMVNFWATWCGPCKVEIPWFIEFADRFHDRGFVVVGIAMDEDGAKSVRPYIQQWGLNYPIVLGSDKLADAYGGIEALPTTFLVDRAGKIAFAHTGLASKAAYEVEITRLIAEKEINN